MSEKVISVQKKMKKKKVSSLMNVLKLVSPGTVLRTAIDDISRAGMGGLIVLNTPTIREISEGGFKVNAELTSQRIVELAKMDGAIILSSNMEKIMNANVLLFPDITIPTKETGTRHKAAERTAKQAGTLVLAISEKRKKISLYHGNLRYILKNPEELLSRATETLQILEKQREVFDELISNLNVLEISDLVVVSDVCSVLQRIEIITRAAKTVERYLIELGREGVIIRMRLRELLKGIDKNRNYILKDYNAKEDTLSEFGFDDLLDAENVAHLLFSLSPEDKVKPLGHRILNKLSLNKKEIEKLVSSFGSLGNIASADEKEIRKVLKDRTDGFEKELSSLKENIVMAKKI
jgi:diadenylate cyclase